MFLQFVYFSVQSSLSHFYVCGVQNVFNVVLRTKRFPVILRTTEFQQQVKGTVRRKEKLIAIANISKVVF